MNALVVARDLEKAGCVCRIVEDGQQALETLRMQPFDLLLMDIQMPVMDGVEATRRIRNGEAGADRVDIPIVALTAYAMVGDREKFLAAGMNGYLSKPVDYYGLQRVIEGVLRQDSRRE